MTGKLVAWTVGRLVSALSLQPDDRGRILDDYGLPHEGQTVTIDGSRLTVRDSRTGRTASLAIDPVEHGTFPTVIRSAIASLGIHDATGYTTVSAPDGKALFAVIEARHRLIAVVPYCKVDARGVPGSECSYVGQAWSH